MKRILLEKIFPGGSNLKIKKLKGKIRISDKEGTVLILSRSFLQKLIKRS